MKLQLIGPPFGHPMGHNCYEWMSIKVWPHIWSQWHMPKCILVLTISAYVWNSIEKWMHLKIILETLVFAIIFTFDQFHCFGLVWNVHVFNASCFSSIYDHFTEVRVINDIDRLSQHQTGYREIIWMCYLPDYQKPSTESCNQEGQPSGMAYRLCDQHSHHYIYTAPSPIY